MAGEKRYLTVLFSDLSDSTLLGVKLESEHYVALLATLRAIFRDAITKFGGRVARVQGDGVLAIFGYPQGQEDDGRRATDAALELHAEVQKLQFGSPPESLSLHTGIHAGLMYLSDGDLETGRFEVLGNVPNVASRLSSLAKADEILISEATLGRAQRFFVTDHPEALELKGQSDLIEVSRVLRRATDASRYSPKPVQSRSPFVGRDVELGRLLGHFERSRLGSRQLVEIVGGPGLGKTRLIEMFLAHQSVQGATILRGFCEAYLGAEPLQPLIQMLRSICGLTSDMSSALARATAKASLKAIVADADVEASSHEQALLQALKLGEVSAEPWVQKPAALASALIEIFLALGRQGRLVLIFDDWQWVDDASRSVIDALLFKESAVFILVASRPIDGPVLFPSNEHRVVLAPLLPAATASIVAHYCSGAGPFVIADINHYAGGNPLFVEELCHRAASDHSKFSSTAWRSSTSWLSQLLESRVAKLPPTEAHIVRVASVIGNVFPLWLLKHLTGHGANPLVLQRLADLDFIFPAEQTGMMRFKHGIARDAIYNAVGLYQRQALHLQIAAALASDYEQERQESSFEVLAYHYGAGGVPDQAAKYSELAGDNAMSAFSLDRARVQYTAALDALDALNPSSPTLQRRWCSIAQKLGMSCVFDPISLANGVNIFERSLALARESQDLKLIARAEYWLGYICYAKGIPDKALLHSKEALRLARDIDDKKLVAQVSATLGQTYLSICDYDRALGLIEGAIDSKRQLSRSGSGIAVGSAYSLACKGGLLADRGDFTQAHTCFQEALTLLGDSVHQVGASVRSWIGLAYLWQGRWEEALEIGKEAVSIAENVRSTQLLAMSRAVVDYSSWLLTKDPRSLQNLRDAMSWVESRKDTLLSSMIYGWLVDATVQIGSVRESRFYAARLFRRARMKDRIGEAMACRALALASAQAGEFARSEKYLQYAVRCAEARGSLHEQASNLLCQAKIEECRERMELAGPLYRVAGELFASLKMHRQLACIPDLVI
jgi:class 3 adenylate cyclase/tetratricopeptide (TPR) repeat protein